MITVAVSPAGSEMAQKLARIRPQGWIPDRIPDGTFWSENLRAADRDGYPTVAAKDATFNSNFSGVLEVPLFGVDVPGYGSIGSSHQIQHALAGNDAGSVNPTLVVVRANAASDITPTTWTVANRVGDITGGVLNGLPFFNNRVAPPVQWGLGWASPTGTAAASLTGWFGATWRCGAIASFRDFLIVMDMLNTSGTVRLENEFRWSDRAVSGALPTVWTASATNEAGSASTGDSPGVILDGKQLGDIFLMYKPESCYRIEEIGLPQVMGKRRVLSTEGIMGRNCIQVINNVQLCVGNADIYQTDGRQAQSIVTDAIRRYFFDNLIESRRQETYTVYNPELGEFWVCFPGSASFDYCSEALVWNGSKWWHRELGNTSVSTGDASEGYPHMFVGQPEDLGVADSWLRLYGTAPANTGVANKLQQVEFDTVGQSTQIEVTGIQLIPGQRAVIRRIFPITKNGTGSTYVFRIGFSDSPDPNDMDWTDASTASFDPSTDDQIGVLSKSARYVGIRTSMGGASTIGNQLVGFDIVFEPGGEL